MGSCPAAQRGDEAQPGTDPVTLQTLVRAQVVLLPLKHSSFIPIQKASEDFFASVNTVNNKKSSSM